MPDKVVERREAERRKAQRRAPRGPWWRSNWKGVVGILAGIATLITPVLDYYQRRAAMDYQFKLELRKTEIEAQKVKP